MPSPWCRVLVVVSLVTFGAAVAQPVVTDPSIQVETVVTGLSSPTTMAFVGPDRFLVLEKNTGKVRHVFMGAIQPLDALDLPVANASEQGLLGIAVHQGTTALRVFLYYTVALSDGGSAIANRITRFEWDPATGTLFNAATLFDLPKNDANHNGGILVADGFGFFFAVIGDLNHDDQTENFTAGAPPGRFTDPSNDTGVIIRFNDFGAPGAGFMLLPYCRTTTDSTPATCDSDADCGAGGVCETAVGRYLAYGIRNSFGMAMDPGSGRLWDTENGEGTDDEINVVDTGFNSGWQPIMGPDDDPVDSSELFVIPGSHYSDPEFTFFDTNGVTAILFPFGSTLGPIYDQVALVGDFNNGFLYRFPLNAARTGFDFGAFPALADLEAQTQAEANLVRIGTGFAGITDLKMGPDGNVYVVSNGAGAVYRLSPLELDFFTLTPCRLIDTRGTPPLQNAVESVFTLPGNCGLPATARAVSLNVTATQPTGGGHLTIFPGNTTLPSTSTINFSAGQTRSNNTVVPLATDGTGTIRVRPVVAGNGTVDLIVDVNGYFE